MALTTATWMNGDEQPVQGATSTESNGYTMASLAPLRIPKKATNVKAAARRGGGRR